ncbi:hypothetical protein BAE44_0024659 [Dichanthelium oligosanthes]|uniref:NB-ARC domain-containing protein n=1 Tax=Dichanthelium oligosanthes TaxID=888268 RepID=A0A1E5UN83_9POAL|nr:hypothetical protein BAE44_0024659 [Dichanthelium oligosanthes]
MVRRLEAATIDKKELVVFLTRCPLLHRQPYSAHLFLDMYMFGRHAERDQVVEFLLQIEPPGATNHRVLPIVGPRFIGKSTLVKHVCNDERVRNYFSFVLFYKGEDLEDETLASFRKNCVIKHQNNSALGERSLIVIELVGDVDDRTWKRLYYSSGRRMTPGSKMILTSRSEKIARFGTTQVLRLKSLSSNFIAKWYRESEAFWYFFKLLVFGSTDPGEHPGLASMAMEMALQARGSFMTAYIMAAMLRADFSRKLWCKVLGMARQYIQKNIALFDKYPNDFKAKPWHVGSLINIFLCMILTRRILVSGKSSQTQTVTELTGEATSITLPANSGTDSEKLTREHSIFWCCNSQLFCYSIPTI